MRFIGENEMILNASTVKLALEKWINSERVGQQLEVTSVTRAANGCLRVRFKPHHQIPKAVAKPADAATNV